LCKDVLTQQLAINFLSKDLTFRIVVVVFAAILVVVLVVLFVVVFVVVTGQQHWPLGGFWPGGQEPPQRTSLQSYGK
jgi:hypothetical protein